MAMTLLAALVCKSSYSLEAMEFIFRSVRMVANISHKGGRFVANRLFSGGNAIYGQTLYTSSLTICFFWFPCDI